MKDEYTIEIQDDQGFWLTPIRFFTSSPSPVRAARKIYKRNRGAKARIWHLIGQENVVVGRLIGKRGAQTLWRI